MFKVSNKDTRTVESWNQLVVSVNYEQFSHIFPVFPLLQMQTSFCYYEESWRYVLAQFCFCNVVDNAGLKKIISVVVNWFAVLSNMHKYDSR